MKPKLIQRVVDQRRRLETDAMRHCARKQDELSQVETQLEQLADQHRRQFEHDNVADLLVGELARARQRLQIVSYKERQLHCVSALDGAQSELREARAERCVAEGIQDLNVQSTKRSQRRRERRQLDELVATRDQRKIANA